MKIITIITSLLAAAALTACGPSRPAVPEIPYDRLLNELTDARRLADLSTENVDIVTSYDRTGGNDDFNHPLRKGPEGWAVIADLKGPGYVNRFWMTGSPNPDRRVLFYFDNESEPKIDMKVTRFFGGQEPFTPPLAANEPYCWFSFVPIPYRKRLIIMTEAGGHQPDGGPKIYYQIAYTPLKNETVASWDTSYAKQFTGAWERARSSWADCRWPAEKDIGLAVVSTNITLQPESTRPLLSADGPGIIKELRIEPDFTHAESALKQNDLLRDIIVQVHWNGADYPSVQCPLGDLAGSPWQQQQYRSMCFGAEDRTFFLRFPMPFEHSAEFKLMNQSPMNIPVRVELHVHPLDSWSDQWGYFHANWRKSGPADVGRPHPILSARGRGRYAGCILSTLSMDKSWWMLEGDEVMYIDGENTPSWHGTGLEDYFNGGWYYGNAIIRAFHGLPFKAPFRTIQYRVHQADPVNFNTSFQMTFERGPDNASRGWMESTAWYYLAEPQAADSRLGSVEERHAPADPVGMATLMMEINNHERLSDYAAARNTIQAFIEQYPKFPFSDIATVRSALYAARGEGADTMTPTLRTLAPLITEKTARQQIDDALWYEETPNRALLGVYANTDTRVYLDGQVIAQVNDAQRMRFFRVEVEAGRHVLAVQAARHPYPDWVQVCLRTHSGDIVSAPNWKYRIDAQGEYWKPDYDDAAWKPVGGLGVKGPPEPPYVWLEPHIFIDMQSHAKGLRPKWKDRQQFVAYRHEFTIP